VSDTKDVKFVVISRLKRARSTFSGVVKLQRCCMPALRKMQSMVGWDLIVLIWSAYIDFGRITGKRVCVRLSKRRNGFQVCDIEDHA
jgi:hypothetical protein